MTNATTTEMDQTTSLYDMTNLEKMAMAVAFTTQCPYCIELHTNKAREYGASDPEIAESVLVAAALRAGGAITHGTHAMK